MLELKNIHKSFGEREILSGVNLKLEKGNVYTLMGANGSGKTTLFNIITNFLKADKGAVFFKKKRIDNLSPVTINSLGITRTFQNLRLIEGLTVKENILLAFKGNKGEKIWNALLPGIFLKDDKNSFEQKANEIIRKVFLDDVAESNAGEISYGQQKLLTLGCCLANDADLLLLDEPVAGINPIYWGKIITIINEVKAVGKTILLIEHHADFIKTISDALLFLNDGTLNIFDDYNQLRNNPQAQEAYL
ncbi:MAG: ATP-binding cassette domain-containing protein [Candidatus Scalindua rubra]|uniref:ABC-type transport system ATP-binding protein n=1 Tax=Candidatus Scalindua brodae TaxID=237368 RepID=A0A0B0EIM9_9BACT|nr:MAG: ABC-type transport system ATP-binding protein [Candidatus Scalindua brodae]MBZ0109125.1 ATP-binding cassette domain-containing protein [Candidatus Scalindua rubra]TWU33561.1 L-cystine import ATP-binding protein TcyN [Candidatus Brocadiaceae bacterium S225]